MTSSNQIGRRKVSVAGVGIVAAMLVVSACSSSSTASDAGASSAPAASTSAAAESSASAPAAAGGQTIAQFLPHTKAVRFQTIDAPQFESAVKAACPDCTVILQNAEGDAGNEQKQMEAAIGQGVNSMVVDPVDGQALAGVINSARQKGIPVISYDALIQDVPLDYYVSFDNVKVGEQIATALVDQMKAIGTTDKCVVAIKGDAKDNNALVFWSGSEPVLKAAGLNICFETNTPEWSDVNAQREMDQAITKIGKENIGGVYSMNDSMAAGIVASLKSAGVDLSMVPVTGQDGDTAAIQRILAGEQYMTVWKDTFNLANTAADVALQFAQGGKPAGQTTVDNGSGTEIPATLLEPVTVTKDNVKDTVVKSGFIKAADLCAGPYADACAAAGIS
jgi:D-xylose transport system substrate-binding protein